MLGLYAIGCDVVDEPYLQNEAKIGDFNKKVVLIDFTAIHCVYCPTANKVANDLAELYGRENVFVIGAHASNLAIPKNEKELNMISEPSSELYAKFGKEAGLPKGMINQRDEDGVKILNFGAWDAALIKESYLDPEMKMAMTLDYNKEERSVKVTVKTDYFVASSEDDNITIYVTEDSLISPQKNPEGGVIEDYVHNHVLRASLTGTFGTQLSSTTIKAGQSIEKTYTYKIPAEFRANHIGFVAFIQNKNTNYLKQATAGHLDGE